MNGTYSICQLLMTSVKSNASSCCLILFKRFTTGFEADFIAFNYRFPCCRCVASNLCHAGAR